MEKFFVIPPLMHMDLAEMNGCQAVYCLAHLCLPEVNPRYLEYKRYFIDKKAAGWHVILDNSAAEDSLVDEDILIALTKELMPTEVIAPDFLFQCAESIIALEHFCTRMQREGLIGKVNIHACPQGIDAGTYLHCYSWMLEHPDVSVIGLSKLSVPASFKHITGTESVSVNRRYLIRLLNELQMIKKPIHCLGMRGIKEYEAYKGIPLIRSTDSCWTCLAAIKGIILKKESFEDHVCSTPHDYFFQTMTEDQVKTANWNILELKDIIEETK